VQLIASVFRNIRMVVSQPMIIEVFILVNSVKASISNYVSFSILHYEPRPGKTSDSAHDSQSMRSSRLLSAMGAAQN
jgi:hypothetical protein